MNTFKKKLDWLTEQGIDPWEISARSGITKQEIYVYQSGDVLVSDRIQRLFWQAAKARYGDLIPTAWLAIPEPLPTSTASRLDRLEALVRTLMDREGMS